MLAQLTPPEITALWRVLKVGIEASLPPLAGEAPDKMNKILTCLVQGTMQCWLAYEHLEQGTKLQVMALTMVVEDYASGTRDLLIYCLFSYVPVFNWRQYFQPIAQWARSKKCRRIIAYSKEPRVLEIASKLGGCSDYHFIEIPICENRTVEEVNHGR